MNRHVSLRKYFIEREFKGRGDYFDCIDFNTDIQKVACGGLDMTLMVWHFDKPQSPYKFVGHTGRILSVNFSPHGRLIATGSEDESVRLWIPNSRGDSNVLMGHKGRVRSVHFSRDSQYLVTSSDDRTVKIWNVERQKVTIPLPLHQNWVRSAQFSPDSRFVVTGCDDKSIKVFDTNSTKCVFSSKKTDTVNCVAFSPVIYNVAAADSSGCIRIWDLRMKQLVQVYKGHDGAVNSLSFTPSNLYFISGSNDKTVKIWNLEEGRVCFTVRWFYSPVNGVSLSKSGDYFTSVSSDSQILLWKANFDEWPEILTEGESPCIVITDKPESASSTSSSSYVEQTNSSGSRAEVPITRNVTFKVPNSVCACCGSSIENVEKQHSCQTQCEKIHIKKEFSSLCKDYDYVADQLSVINRKLKRLEQLIEK